MSWEVHIDWQGQTSLVGRLHAAGRGPAVSFEYAPEWLKRADAFSIDPTPLPPRTGAQHSPVLFGAIQDCGPDRWGRLLIERAVRKKVLDQKPYRDIDYMLALDDASRLGALRFRLDSASPFLAVSTGKLPPLVRLQALLRAADAVHSETDTAADLRFLLGAGSPLGGARPKSAVSLADGQLALAKFPKPDDTRDIAAGEILALTLAAEAGIRDVEHQLVPVGKHSVAVITRFDRAANARIPFLSGASLLGLSPGDAGAYTRLADAIRQFGHDVADDLRELWRRLLFSLLASNYDDHLRNHGFLMHEAGRWSLSPAYDLNPVPEIDRPRPGEQDVFEIDGEKKKFDYRSGGNADWLRRIDTVKMHALTPGKIQAWKIAYLAEAGADPIKAMEAKRNVNSFIRCARSLFSRKATKFVQNLKLPDPLPFAGIEMEKAGSMRYKSEINLRSLFTAARSALGKNRPEQYKIFLLAIGAGLRRAEIDCLMKSQIDWENSSIWIGRTKYFSPKTEDSEGTVDVDSALLTELRRHVSEDSGEFVIKSPREARPGAGWQYYRCDREFDELTEWLRSRGITDNKPLHALRKEFGSQICAEASIYAAKESLRHGHISTTAAHYLDRKKRTTLRVGHLLRPKGTQAHE